VPPAGVVEALDVLEDRRPRYLPGWPAAPLEKLRLEGGDERLGEGVVVGRAHPTRRGYQPFILEPLSERQRSVLHSSVRVVHEPRSGLAPRDRHLQGVYDEFGPQVCGHRPADHLVARTSKYADRHAAKFVPNENPEIECIILDRPRFFEEREFFKPEDHGKSFPRQVVRLKYFNKGFDEISITDVEPPVDDHEPFQPVDEKDSDYRYAAFAHCQADDVAKKKLQEKEPDLFAHTVNRVTLRSTTIGDLQGQMFDYLAPPGLLPFGPEDTALYAVPGRGGRPITPARPALATYPSTNSGILVGQLRDTKQQGSYNVIVKVSGTSPLSNTRFVRKGLVSALVK
jgi:hypothetical protein